MISSNEEMGFGQIKIEELKLITDHRSKCLLLIHNRSSGMMKAYHLSNLPNMSVRSIDLNTNALTAGKDLFDSMLGHKARSRLYAVSYLEATVCKSPSSELIQLQLQTTQILGNMYFEHFNLDYIDVISVICNKSVTNVNHTAVQLIPKRIYREFSNKVEPITK